MNIRKIRVEKIRQFMIKEKLDAYLILSADPHLNEYLQLLSKQSFCKWL